MTASARRVLVPVELAPLPAPAAASAVFRLHGQTMGTTWSVSLVGLAGLPLADLRTGIQQQLDHVVSQMSTWQADSAISRFNRATAPGWYVLPEELFSVADYGFALARETAGACDPTVGALVDLWGFGPHPASHRPPPAEAVTRAQRLCGWYRIEVDRERRRLFQPGGVQLDLSGIAKGHAVDRVVRYLHHQGVTSYLVEVGGELSGFGAKPDGQPWWVGLERPPEAGDSGLVVALHGLAVATSGDYRRYFTAGGRRYSHTLDPHSGWPVDNGLAAVTVLHRHCLQADALATALTVLGPADGFEFARRRSLAALFVHRTETGFAERMTPAFAAMLSP